MGVNVNHVSIGRERQLFDGRDDDDHFLWNAANICLHIGHCERKSSYVTDKGVNDSEGGGGGGGEEDEDDEYADGDDDASGCDGGNDDVSGLSNNTSVLRFKWQPFASNTCRGSKTFCCVANHSSAGNSLGTFQPSPSSSSFSFSSLPLTVVYTTLPPSDSTSLSPAPTPAPARFPSVCLFMYGEMSWNGLEASAKICSTHTYTPDGFKTRIISATARVGLVTVQRTKVVTVWVRERNGHQLS